MIRMGRSSKPEQSEPRSTQPQPAPQQQNYGSESVAVSSRAVSDSESMARDIKEGRLSGFVGHGTVLSGETNFQAMLRVDGHLVGSVTSESGTLLVGSNGQVDANIAVSSAVVNGVVNGDIIATERVQLGRTARVIGNIQTPRVVIEDGAVFEGTCMMMKAREAIEERAAQIEASRYTAAPVTDTAADEDNDLFSGAADEDEDEAAEAAVV